MPDFRVRRFTSPSMTFVLRDRNGNAVDITGYTFRFAAKRFVNDPDSDKLFDVTPTIVSAVDGEYQITLTSQQTAIPAGSYPAELRWWTSGGPPSRPSDAEASTFTVDEAIVKTEV